MNTDIYSDNPDTSWYLVSDHASPDKIVQGQQNAKMLFEGGNYTSRSCGYKTEALLREHNCILDTPCCECGGVASAHYVKDTKEAILKDSICFTCLHWRGLAEKADNPSSVRVKGSHYQIGSNNSTGEFRGFGGRVFHIRFFDGREVECSNLWHQGTVTQPWRSRLPDNAEFINK